ncbi:MAG TPA: S8 family serine peptidase, partial [Herpetosiphonaceae bacterium]
MTIQGAAQLGTVKTVSVRLGNSEPQPFAAQVYEALAAPTPRAHAPAAAMRVPLPPGPQPISEALASRLAADPAAEVQMLVYLRDQADLGPASAVAGWAERGQAVYDTLTSHARRTQAPLLEWLGQIAPAAQPQPFWIVNAIALRGDLELARRLAGRAEVAILTTNATQALAPNESQQPATGDETAWGLEKINAPAAWADWGARGQGIVVANIDTGVAYSHTALLQSYRGWSAGQIDHNYNWFAAAGDQTAYPTDGSGHGTHTMGTLVGKAAGGMPAVGVAPGARWIAVRGCPGFFCSQTELIAAAEWLLAPRDLAGLNPRPDLRPHIINNSWGGEDPTDWFDGYVTAWNAAGMASVFSNGNSGRNGCGSTVTPARSALVFSVGATDSADQAWELSSRGPAPDGRTKPDLAAPGVDVLSTWPDGRMMRQSGTSMAAPHV